MNKPLISKKEIILKHNIKSIWKIVVNNEDYKWRTGVKKLELLENGEWLEFYDKSGKNFTKFSLKDKKEYSLYSFKMNNKNFEGEWEGKFIEIDEINTKCIFTETLYMKNAIMNVLAKLFFNLDKIQKQYFMDLNKKLEE
jgi:hypothetical protein